jgi:hypothetical protein
MTREQRNKHFEKELRDYWDGNNDTPLNEAMVKFTKRLKEWENDYEPIIDESEYPKTRKLTNPKTGDIAICWGNKFHNWDGPALFPKGNKKQGEYYLYGIRYEMEEWKEMKKQWEGLPWYKTPAILMDAGSARN